MQKEFIPLVEDMVRLSEHYFRRRLVAIYLHGSVAMGDAVPYVSDLDSYLVLSKELGREDKRYLERTQEELQQRYPAINGVHLSAHSANDLTGDPFARFVLRYNSILCYGNDIAGEIDNSGWERFEPNAEMAKGRLAFARKCFEQALDCEQPMYTGEIPTDPCLASRKYARYFVVIEGAYFLMSRNQFESFEKEDVLNKLYQYASAFKKELDMTREILKDSKAAGIAQDEFLRRIRPLVEWMFDRIEET